MTQKICSQFEPERNVKDASKLFVPEGCHYAVRVLGLVTRLSFFDNTDIHVEGYYPYGTDISDYVGDLAGVNNNAAYNSPRLNELWVQRGFQIEMLECSVRTGLLAADGINFLKRIRILLLEERGA